MLTIVCLFNNREIFEKCLLASLKKQQSDYEGIFVDNTQNTYNCAAKAFNDVVKKARGEYIVFAHQDIVIDDPKWLSKTEESLVSLADPGIVGVAGCKENDRGVYTNIRHGSNKSYAGQFRVKEPIVVQTIDECLFIVPKKVLDNIQFDEETCNNWHFYAIDFCLQSKLCGLNVFVIPTEIYHLSPGNSLNLDYYKTAKKVCKKYKRYYKIINTTCSSWESDKFLLQYFIRAFKHKIKNKFQNLKNRNKI